MNIKELKPFLFYLKMMVLSLMYAVRRIWYLINDCICSILEQKYGQFACVRGMNYITEYGLITGFRDDNLGLETAFSNVEQIFYCIGAIIALFAYISIKRNILAAKNDLDLNHCCRKTIVFCILVNIFCFLSYFSLSKEVDIFVVLSLFYHAILTFTLKNTLRFCVKNSSVIQKAEARIS